MRFGISPLSLELIIDIVLREKGLAGLSQFSLSKLVEGVAEAGYNHCEISLDTFQIFPIQITDDEIERLKTIKKKYNISYSAHFPFLSIELASPNQFIRKGSVKSIIAAFNTFIELEEDIEMYILHPTGEFIKDAMGYVTDPTIYPLATNIFMSNSIQSIREIIEKTGITPSKIAIENVEFPFEATIKIIKELNTKLCIDTAHILGGFSGNHNLIDITKRYLDITGEIHLQDYSDELMSDHAVLGTGKNFPLDFFEIIDETKFDGPIVFELNREDAFMSVKYIKKYAPYIKIPEIKNKDFF
ncbi:MAG: TIM barrel protein [Promethearchaeota archaeon]|jgi:sugar phosphate isomerase/epimerase